MPSYAYRSVDEFACEHCREGFTVRQSVADEPLPFCPQCGAAVARQVVPFATSRGFANRPPSEKRLKQAGFKVLRRNEHGGYDVT